MSLKLVDQLDTNLLRVLHTLLVERSVTRTALKLGQTQPAISNMLKRLRDITGDAILVRGKSGMTATARGLELQELARQTLDLLEHIANPAPQFNPQQSQRCFQLGAPDYLSASLIPGIIEQLRLQAPQASLMVHALNAGFDYNDALEKGELDCVIGNWPEPPPHLHLAHLFSDELVCLVRANHPIINKGLSLRYYLEMAHLAPTPFVIGHRSIIDSTLAEHGYKRKIQMTIPYLGMVADVLSRTDLIFTTSRYFAEQIARDKAIALLPVPIVMPAMRYFMLWHERAHAAPEVQWLRRVIAQVAPADSSV